MYLYLEVMMQCILHYHSMFVSKDVPLPIGDRREGFCRNHAFRKAHDHHHAKELGVGEEFGPPRLGQQLTYIQQQDPC